MEAPRTVLVGRSRGAGRAAVAPVAFALAIGYGQPLFASLVVPPLSKVWIGGGAGSWQNPLAWLPRGVPNNLAGLEMIAVVEGAVGESVTVSVDQDVAISGVTVGAGDAVAVAGATAITFETTGLSAVASIDGAVHLAGPESALMVDGILAIDGQGVLTLDHSTARLGAAVPGAFLATFDGLTIVGGGQLGDGQLALHNGGTIRADAPMVIDPGSGIAAFVNFGLLHVAAPLGSLAIAEGSVESWGEIRVDAGTTLVTASPIMASAGSVRVDGVIADGNDSQGQTLLMIAAGELSGSGTVGVGLTIGAVTVDPDGGHSGSGTPDPIGTLTVQDFGGTPETRFRFDVRSTSTGEHDRFASTTGGVFEDGTVELRMIDGCVPAASDEIEIVHVAESFVNPPTVLESCYAAELIVTPNSIRVRFNEGSGVRCDVDLDGAVGPQDLAVLLGAWGNEGACVAGDLSGDGRVDAADLGLLLGGWTR